MVWHCQYIASSDIGYKASALDSIIHAALLSSKEKKVRYFDFGTSTWPNSNRLNQNLYDFKSEFGGGGVAYEKFTINLLDYEK